MEHRKSDRRSTKRYEASQPMWGTIGLTRDLTLRDIGRGGAQTESPVALPLNSAHVLTLPFLGGLSLSARVRHAAPIEQGAGPRAFRVGFEFVAPTPDVLQRIDAIVAELLSRGWGREEH